MQKKTPMRREAEAAEETPIMLRAFQRPSGPLLGPRTKSQILTVPVSHFSTESAADFRRRMFTQVATYQSARTAPQDALVVVTDDGRIKRHRSPTHPFYSLSRPNETRRVVRVRRNHQLPEMYSSAVPDFALTLTGAGIAMPDEERVSTAAPPQERAETPVPEHVREECMMCNGVHAVVSSPMRALIQATTTCPHEEEESTSPKPEIVVTVSEVAASGGEPPDGEFLGILREEDGNAPLHYSHRSDTGSLVFSEGSRMVSEPPAPRSRSRDVSSDRDCTL